MMTLLPKVESKNIMENSIVYDNIHNAKKRSSNILIIADKHKYRRSISNKRSQNFTSNLTQLLNENKKKELEIQREEKIRMRKTQTKQRNDLRKQIQLAKDFKRQLNKSEKLMDEEYIKM